MRLVGCGMRLVGCGARLAGCGAVVLFVILSVRSCNRITLVRHEVIGSWECKRGPRISCIDIHDDGTYQQFISVNGVHEFSSSSDWTWDKSPGAEEGISFRKFYSLNRDGSAIRQQPGWWYVIPEGWLIGGTEEMVVFADEGIAFTKRKTPCPKPVKQEHSAPANSSREITAGGPTPGA